MNDGSAAAGPRIERVNAKIGTLERRIEWLRQRLAAGDRPERQQTFDRVEVEALEAACAALRYHRQALDADTDPVLALAELNDALEALWESPDASSLHGKYVAVRLEDARARARRVLRELSPE